MKLTILLLVINFIIVIIIRSQKLVSIGAILLRRASIVTVLTSFITNSWYAFILFLIYITGLLVLFRYFIALSPNSYNTSKKCFKAYIFILIPICFIPSFYVTNLPTFKIRYEKDVISLFIRNNIPIYIFIVITLLLLLLIVVSLTYKSPSPLRHYLN